MHRPYEVCFLLFRRFNLLKYSSVILFNQLILSQLSAWCCNWVESQTMERNSQTWNATIHQRICMSIFINRLLTNFQKFSSHFFRKEEGFVGEKKFVNDTELFYLMRWLLRGVNICEIELTIYQRRVWVKRFYALHS